MGDDTRSLSPMFADIGDVSLDGSFDDFLGIVARSIEPPLPPPDISFNHYATTNAVHMEIQNNAKLPTFNLSVDRRNSSSVPRVTSQQPYSPTTRRDIEEIMRLSENDISLSEVFLKSSDRTSQNRNYSAAGALFHATASSSLEPNLKSPAIKPLPTSTTYQESPSAQSAHSYYRRPYPLPIPVPVVRTGTKAENSEMDNAVAIAAAIVSQSKTLDSQTENMQNGEMQTPTPVAPSPVAPTPVAPIPMTANAYVPIPFHGQVQQFHPPRYATAHLTDHFPYSRLTASVAAPTPQLIAATMQRSQFGFGGNHQVPSVPDPPKRAYATNRMTTSITTTTGATRTGLKDEKKRKGKPYYPNESASPLHTNSLLTSTRAGPAYERKKQRAKDARTRLNDSIEALSIAMSFAGTQSQERSEAAAARWHPDTRKVMEECAQTAESAKKWERPEFVGTAATLILSLNSQCEALAQELRNYQTKTASTLTLTSTSVPIPTTPTTTSMTASYCIKNGSCHPRPLSPHESGTYIDTNDRRGDSDSKRRKLEQSTISDTLVMTTTESGTPNLVFSNPKILIVLASYLCPQSLLRCQCICKRIRDSFQQDSLWLDRCIQRFGLKQVRQWQEKLDYSDDFDVWLGPLSSCELYCQMDVKNVKPVMMMVMNNTNDPDDVDHQYHHAPPNTVTTTVLAEARLPHKVSAWVTMVERSNGETTRSVRQANGRYTSVPVVELRIYLQNTGLTTSPVVMKEHVVTVDASTRRRGEEWREVVSDPRFAKRLLDVQGSGCVLKGTATTTSSSSSSSSCCRSSNGPSSGEDELVRLRLFETVVLVVHILCKGCTTLSKFQQRANFVKILIQMNGITVPLAIPFLSGGVN